MPRLLVDGRRQVLLDGYPDGESQYRYRAVYSPFAFDRRAETAALEWVFYVDRVWPLSGGDRLEIDPRSGTLLAFAGKEKVAELPWSEDWVDLPFQWPEQP